MSALKFLLLEDSLLDIELIEALLAESDIECKLISVKAQPEFESALEQGGFDLILSDYSLPGFDGIAALKIAQANCPDVPFIFVTATMGEEVAIETLKRGAIDYVLKQRLERLVPAVQRALREAEERRARKQAETELYRQEQEYRALVENSPDIIIRQDKNYRTLYVCPAITEATGLPVEHFIGKTPAEQGYPAEVSTPWMEEMRQLLEQKQGRLFQFKFDTLDGTRYYDVRMVPELATDGSIETILSVIRDITEAKQTEDKLRQQKEELEQLNRVKDEFLAVLSHELRSPLNAILGWSRILRSRQVDTVTQERALETIERNAKLQTQLIEDLLDVSRIIRGKLSLRSQKTDLVPAIEAAIDTMRLAAEAKQIDFQFLINEGVGSSPCGVGRNEGVGSQESGVGRNKEYMYPGSTSPTSSTPDSPLPTPHSPFLVLGDPNRLQQIVWNLLSNAIKFTPSGGKVEVLLELVGDRKGVASRGSGAGEQKREYIDTPYSGGGGTPSGGGGTPSGGGGTPSGGGGTPPLPPHTYAQITIKDTGMGIRSDFIPYVFESFRQADGSTTRKYGGLGLGLAIVRHLVELHGGYVSASSPGEGQGATFVVQIPLLIKNLEPKVQNSESKFSPSAFNVEDSESTENLELSGVRILVVDDDTDSRDFLDFALLDAGAQTTAVDSAAAAFEALSSSQFNVLVSDIGMPQEDGYSLIQRIRKLPAEKGGTIPAIALTAYASDADRNAAIAAGFQNHLPKPIAPDDLVNAISELVKGVGSRE